MWRMKESKPWKPIWIQWLTSSTNTIIPRPILKHKQPKKTCLKELLLSTRCSQAMCSTRSIFTLMQAPKKINILFLNPHYRPNKLKSNKMPWKIQPETLIRKSTEPKAQIHLSQSKLLQLKLQKRTCLSRSNWAKIKEDWITWSTSWT